MKYLIILFLLSSCSHKIIGKNCMVAINTFGESEEKEQTGDRYHVCDSLNILGN